MTKKPSAKCWIIERPINILTSTKLDHVSNVSMEHTWTPVDNYTLYTLGIRQRGQTYRARHDMYPTYLPHALRWAQKLVSWYDIRIRNLVTGEIIPGELL